MSIKHRHQIILEEKDVTKALHIISKEQSIGSKHELCIGNCGSADRPNMWFIHFKLSNEDWKSVILRLQSEINTLIIRQ